MGLSSVPESWAVKHGQYSITVCDVATYPPVGCEVCHKSLGMMVDSLPKRSVAGQQR